MHTSFMGNGILIVSSDRRLKMPFLNPQIIRFLERKQRRQLLDNIFFLIPYRGILIISFLEYLLSCLFVILISVYEPIADEESLNLNSPWLSSYTKFLNRFEIWFMVDRTIVILTTTVMFMGYRFHRRSLLLPYIAYLPIAFIGNLASLCIFDTSSYLTTGSVVILSFELSSGLTVRI